MTKPRAARSEGADEIAASVIVVAVLSYRRLERLVRILPALVEQATPHAARVLVVDNDPEGGAQELVSTWSDRGVSYAHEPIPGISAARNRALTEAADADALVFIDDDEHPEPAWLDQLIAGWRRWGSAAVTGPSLPIFDEAAEPWVLASGVLDRERRATGLSIRSAASNNLLLDMKRITGYGLRFDERFGLSGGEDTLFCRTLTSLGGDIRWCEEAVVTSKVPAERATRQWMLKRAFRTGTTWSRVAVLLTKRRRIAERAILLARSLGRMAKGCGYVVRGRLTRNLGSRARGAIVASGAAGMFLGALGYTQLEYKRPANVDPVVV